MFWLVRDTEKSRLEAKTEKAPSWQRQRQTHTDSQFSRKQILLLLQTKLVLNVINYRVIKIRQPTRMLRQTRQPMSVFLIPVNQSTQIWHHSTPEYIWHQLPNITKTCQTGYTNHDIIHLKVAHDLIFMRYHSILFMRSRQKVMTSLALMYSSAF